MVTLDRIRLTGLLPKSPAPGGLLHYPRSLIRFGDPSGSSRGGLTASLSARNRHGSSHSCASARPDCAALETDRHLRGEVQAGSRERARPRCSTVRDHREPAASRRSARPVDRGTCRAQVVSTAVWIELRRRVVVIGTHAGFAALAYLTSPTLVSRHGERPAGECQRLRGDAADRLERAGVLARRNWRPRGPAERSASTPMHVGHDGPRRSATASLSGVQAVATKRRLRSGLSLARGRLRTSVPVGGRGVPVQQAAPLALTMLHVLGLQQLHRPYGRPSDPRGARIRARACAAVEPRAGVPG